MPAASKLDEEMVASYAVTIEGVERTRKEMEMLDKEIRLLRSTNYSGSQKSVTIAASAERTSTRSKADRDIFTTKFAAVEGRVQTQVREAVASSMALGKKTQAAALDAAETKTGVERVRRGGGGTSGRHTGKPNGMIQKLATNVESFRGPGFTSISGWHGWSRDARSHFEFQEKGTKGKGGSASANSGVSRNPNRGRKRYAGQRGSNGSGVPAANSLGLAIPVVREHLKRELGAIR
jgi:hypothetical protein